MNSDDSAGVPAQDEPAHDGRLSRRRGRELESALSTALAIMRAGYIRLDREGRVTDMNDMAQEATGWPLSEAIGVSVWEVFRRDGRPEEFLRRNPIDLVQEQGWQLDEGRTMVLISRQGARLRTDVRAAVTRDHHGEIDGMVVVFRDQSHFFEAQTNASRLAAIVESSHDAIVAKTLDGRITSWNTAAEQLFGYSASEAIGMPVTRLIPLERRHEEMMILERIGRGERIPALQTVRLTKEGRRVDVALTISPVHDGDGHIVGAAKIVRDITAQIEAARAQERIESLERKNREVLEAMHMKSRFFASMSHELRTPLNAVIGFAQLLEDPLRSLEDDKRQQFAGHILHAGRHLLALINDLLELSKTQAGKVDFHPTEFDLAEVIQELTSTMRPLADSKGHRLSLDLDPDVGTVFLDASRLRQVLYNYLSNAIKFTPNCGEIVIRTRARGWRSFLLEVQDNGIGLSEEEQAELFEEFRQLRRKSGQDEAGTGLGLALTRRLAMAQGGKAGVWSVVGQGCRFFVVLPRRHRTPEDGAGKVVVVDDDSALNRGLIERLKAAGHEAERLSDVDAAGRLAQGQGVDAFVLGLEVGGRSGLELLGSRMPGRANAPVSGLNIRLDQDLATTLPVADVMLKPPQAEGARQALALCAAGPRQPTVLVVDDDASARALIAEHLRRHGAEVRLAGSGREALAALDHELPDLVILDLLMGDIDGFDVLLAIRHRADLTHLPVCIWTALTLSAEDQERLRRWATRVLAKGDSAISDLLGELLPLPVRREFTSSERAPRS